MIEVDIQLPKAEFSLQAKFSVAAAGVTGVFGPSGSGKTSLLRALAGLEPAVSGFVRIAGTSWLAGKQALTVEERGAGFVFQDSSLFPHLSVLDNLLYAQKRRKKSSYPIDLDYICDAFQLQQLLHRNTRQLSGGERQRVAIGRTLLGSPALLLLDEPLSALDQGARTQLILILEKLFQQIEIPVLYVSHASEEIARLADNLLLLDAGRVTAYGELGQVLGQVNSPFNESDEAFSVLRCRTQSEHLPHLTSVVSAGGASLHIPRQEAAPDSEVRLRIRARDVSLSLMHAQGSSILNILPVRIVALAQVMEQGSRTVKLDLAGDSLLARVSEYSVQQLQLQPGMDVFAQIKSVSLIS